ncbi:MAG: ABC transporter permease [Parvibaculaceae bacterium]
MLKQLLRRLAVAMGTLFVVSVLIFAGTEVLPGDLASAILQNNATPETVAAMREELGLDRPAVTRYLEWLSGAVQGDLGTSLANKRDVATEVMPRLWNTLFLAAYAALVAVPLAIGLGVLSAIRQGGVLDRLSSILTLFAISMPEYFLAYLLIKYFSVRWGMFPSLATMVTDAPLLERLNITFLPMLTLVLVTTAHMMRMTRASILSVMSSSYIEMAVLKGLPKWRIVIEHALRNAVGPISSIVALNLAYLIVGVVVVEVVFVYPGLGQLMVDAVSKHDVPVVQACGLIFAAIFVLLNMTADLLAISMNPRIRYPR